MATATRRTETENAVIEIELTRAIAEKVAYMDGYNIPAGQEVYERYEVTITSKRNGATIKASGKPGGFAFFTTQGKYTGKFPRGAYARIGDSYVSEGVYSIAAQMIAELDAELGKSNEQVEIEQVEARKQEIGQANMDRIAAEHKERQQHPGWCNRCHSYCYGDCRS